MRKRRIGVGIVGLLMAAGCATSSGTLGSRSERTVVILGEHQEKALAHQYAQQYGAIVWYTPRRGALADVVSSSLRATVGPSSAMKSLINELKTLNGTSGAWTIIVPGMAERYFLVTLRNMEDGALAQTSGRIQLVDSEVHADLEQEVRRVSYGALTVHYQDEGITGTKTP